MPLIQKSKQRQLHHNNKKLQQTKTIHKASKRSIHTIPKHNKKLKPLTGNNNTFNSAITSNLPRKQQQQSYTASSTIDDILTSTSRLLHTTTTNSRGLGFLSSTTPFSLQQQQHHKLQHKQPTHLTPRAPPQLSNGVDITTTFNPLGIIPNPITTTQRFFLGQLFEKQRKMSWVLHRRKKMEMSADMLSRPVHRPPRTESMDLIMKKAHDVTLGEIADKQIHPVFKTEAESRLALERLQREYHPDQISKALVSSVASFTEVDKPLNDVPMKKLSIRQQMRVLWMASRQDSFWLFGTYLSLWAAQFGVLMYQLKTDPSKYRKLYLDVMDVAAGQSVHQVIDSYPNWTDFLLAFTHTSTCELFRVLFMIGLAKWKYEKNGVVQLEQEEYDKIKFLYELKPRFDYDLKMDDIDPNLAAGLVPHPGTETPPRPDYYGRDRWRDYVPKGKPELEYALYSWQRVAMVRRRREQKKRRGKSKKSKIQGPRWAKVGFGIFSGR